MGLAVKAQGRLAGALGFGRAHLTLAAARLDLVKHGVAATALNEIGTVQLAVLEVQPQAAGIAQVAAAAGRQTAASRQRVRVGTHHLAARRQAAEAVLALDVGDQVGAVTEQQPHTGNTQLLGVLHMVAVAVNEDLAQHASLGGKHATADAHAVLALVGGHAAGQRRTAVGADAAAGYAAGKGLGTVDGVALLTAHPHPHAVLQQLAVGQGHRTQVEGQHRTGAAQRVSDDDTVHHRRASHIGEAGRQAVDHRALARPRTRCQLHRDAVAQRIAELDHRLVTGLAQADAAGQRGVDRDVVVHDVGHARAGAEQQPVLGADADRRGGCRRLRLGVEHRIGPTRRAQRAALRRDQGRGRGVAGRRRHRQSKAATGRRRGRKQVLVEAVHTHRHGHRAAVDGIATQGGAHQLAGRVPSRAGTHRRQRDHRTGHRLAQAGVVDHAAGVDRQALLGQLLAGCQHHGQGRVGAAAHTRAGAANGRRASRTADRARGARCGFTIDRVAEDHARGRIAEADGQRDAGHQVANAVAAIGAGGGACH